MLIKNQKVYDALKYIAQIVVPGLGALYFALAEIWGWPNANEVLGTLAAIDVFLGLLLGLSTKAYNASDEKFDGTATVVGDSAVKFNVDVRDLLEKDEILLKVKPPQELVGGPD